MSETKIRVPAVSSSPKILFLQQNFLRFFLILEDSTCGTFQ